MQVLLNKNKIRQNASGKASIFLNNLNWSIEHASNPEINSTRVIAVSFIPELSDDARDFVSKIRAFGGLTANWDGYQAIPPTTKVIAESVEFVKWADKHELPLYFTAPGPNGEVIVELKKEDCEAEIHFQPDDSTEVLLCVDDVVTSEGDLTSHYDKLLNHFHATAL